MLLIPIKYVICIHMRAIACVTTTIDKTSVGKLEQFDGRQYEHAPILSSKCY